MDRSVVELKERGSGVRWGRRCGVVLATSLLLALGWGWPPAAVAAPSVTEFTGGVTAGFSANRSPKGNTTGPDGNIWFTEFRDPGGLGRVNPDGSVTEFTGGLTAGFSANRSPDGITTGPDGNIWFTELAGPGAVGRITLQPGAATGAASGVEANSGTLGGTVHPRAQLTVYSFEYGTSSAYGSQTASTSAGSGVAPGAVSAAISGLAPNTLYHYRLSATNDSGTTVGADRSFTTAPGGGQATPLVFGAKTLVTLKLSTKRIPASGPLEVMVSNATAFAVSGKLAGITTKRVAVARPKNKRRIKLRAQALSVRANAKKPVKLKLPKPLRRLLKRNGKLSLRLTAKVTDPPGKKRTVNKKVSPKLNKKRETRR